MRGSRYGDRDLLREFRRHGDLERETLRESDAKILDGRSMLVPLYEAGSVVALSESDSTISPSDGEEE